MVGPGKSAIFAAKRMARQEVVRRMAASMQRALAACFMRADAKTAAAFFAMGRYLFCPGLKWLPASSG